MRVVDELESLGASGEPVEQIVRSADRSWVSAGRMPALADARR